MWRVDNIWKNGIHIFFIHSWIMWITLLFFFILLFYRRWIYLNGNKHENPGSRDCCVRFMPEYSLLLLSTQRAQTMWHLCSVTFKIRNRTRCCGVCKKRWWRLEVLWITSKTRIMCFHKRQFTQSIWHVWKNWRGFKK